MMPLTIDFMVSPGIAGTAHDRGAAHPSRPRKHWPGYWPAGGVVPGPRRATTWHCAEPNGKQVITTHTLDQLLDKLDELTREREP